MNKTDGLNFAHRTNERLENIFSYFSSRYRLFTVLCFLFMVIIMIFGAPFKVVLREDAYVYLLKGFEITEGNWVPIRSHSIGWSIFLAFFLEIFSIKSLFNGMILSRILSILLMGLSVFPLSGIASRALDRKSAIVAVAAFTLSSKLIVTGREAYSEPLFFFIVISTVYFLVNSYTKSSNMLIATILGSISFYVRPNGIFMLGVIYLYLIYLLWCKKINWSFLLVVPGLYFLVSLPHLYARHEAFGSPTSFGINSQFFADSVRYTLSSGHGESSAIETLKTYSIWDYYDKF
ncbi:MAG: hypothetical protein ACRENT_09180, partial [Thermodesulfobacteriota bacterium]